MPMTEKQLRARDARRDVWAETLEAMRDIKAGKGRIASPKAAVARSRIGLSQPRFAALLGVSVRTVQEWEQGRRQPTGAARTLLRIAERHPRALLDLTS